MQDVTFLTGGYPAPYINRTSSVLQVTQREGNREKFGGWATLGFAGAGAILEGPINLGRGRAKDRGWCRRDGASWICSPRTSGSAACRCCIRSTPRRFTTSRPRPHLAGQHRGHRRDSARASPNPPTSKTRLPTSTSATTAGAAPRASTGSGPSGRAAWACWAITHSEAKVGQQVKDLVAQGVPPPGVPPEVVIAQSPVVYSEDSREGETTHQVRPHRARAVLRHGAGRRQLQGVPHRLHGGVALRQRHAVLAGARHRSVLSRHAIPVVPDRRLSAGLEAGGPARERHAGRARRPLRHPVAGPLQPARGRQRAPHRHAVVELERRVVLSAAGVPLRLGLSSERVARALARRPLRDGPSLVARRVPSRDRRGVSEDVQRLPGGQRSAHRVAGQHRRHVRRARDPVSAHQRRQGLLGGRGVVRREAAHLEALRPGEPVVLAHAPRGSRRRAPARLVRLPVRVQPARRLSAVAGMGALSPALVSVRPAIHAV